MKHKVLANGLQILLAPMQSAEVTIAVAFKSGSRYEKKETAGLSHFCEHAIAASGTERFPTETILNRVMDSVGGEFNGFTSRDIVMIYLTLAKRKINLGIELVSEMLLRPVVTNASIEIARNIIVNEFKSALENPDEIICDMKDGMMFENSSLSLDTETELANSIKFKLWQIRQHYKKMVRPNRMIVSIAGDFDPDKALAAVERAFGGLHKGYPMKYRGFEISQPAAKIALRANRMNQVGFSLGFPTFGYDDSRRYALVFLNNLVAGRDSSILSRVLRSELGLVHGVDSFIWQWPDAGYFAINADTGKRQDFFRIIGLILSELDNLKRKLVDKDEFGVSLGNLRARAKKQFTDSKYAAKFYAGQFATCGRTISLREHLRQLNGVRRADVRRVANDVFDFKRINLAAIGRVSEKDEERLRSIIDEKAREVFIS